MVKAVDSDLVLQIVPDADDDAAHLEELTALLREELLELDVDSVEPVSEERAPEGSKGVLAALGGWLAVHFGASGVKGVLSAIVAWAGRTGKTVEVTLDGNTLKLTGTNSEVQARIVEEFLARHSSHG